MGERVQIGDMASERGGTLSMHSSHQNGLDADIAYLQTDQLERDPEEWGERGFEVDFVRNKHVTRNFDQKRNWFLLKEIVSRGTVSRIFVDPEIKRLFCERSSKLDPTTPENVRIEVLRRLRPYPDHDDHFHLRIDCPASSKKCLNQAAPPPGSGCTRIDEFVDFFEHDELRGSPQVE
jgi:penicillin-insensitive murein endopeptidase